MSWTSEFELPPPRPSSSTGDDDTADEIEAGPLDPAVFDGLFTELDTSDDSNAGGQPSETEEPSSTEQPGEALHGLTYEAEVEVRTEYEPVYEGPVTHQDESFNVEQSTHNNNTDASHPLSQQQAGQQRPAAAVVHQSVKPRRRWITFVSAILIGAGAGVVGALLLVNLLVNDSDEPQPEGVVVTGDGSAEQPDATSSNEETVDSGTKTEAGPVPAQLATWAESGSLDINSIRFEPGTLSMTADSSKLLDDLVAVATNNPNNPAAITIRSYSEPTAAANLELSRQQATTIFDYLVAAGFDPNLLVVTGLGSPPLSTAQPVRNFIEVSSGLGQLELKVELESVSSFAIGIDPTTGKLRPESIEHLTILADALLADNNASIGLAAYSFQFDDPATNQVFANRMLEATNELLVDELGVNPAQIATFPIGDAPYIVGPRLGNHISLQWGANATTAFALATIDRSAIGFSAGTSQLDETSLAPLSEAATLTISQGSKLVIDLHCFEQSSRSANQSLSESRGEVLLAYLVESGLGPDQVRVHANGDIRQFRDEERPTQVVLTALVAS